jgi:hypothetical protein
MNPWRCSNRNSNEIIIVIQVSLDKVFEVKKPLNSFKIIIKLQKYNEIKDYYKKLSEDI